MITAGLGLVSLQFQSVYSPLRISVYVSAGATNLYSLRRAIKLKCVRAAAAGHMQSTERDAMAQ